MSFSHNKTHSYTAKKEQIITEVFPKSLHIILESRAPNLSARNSSAEQNVSSSSSSSSSIHKSRDRWFNLALTKCSASLENIDLWRESILDPMIIDVILVQRVFKPEVEKSEGFHETITEKIIERWIVQYDIRETKDSNSRSKRSCGSLDTFYKNVVLLLRSLYTTVRILPAYKLFRELSSTDHMRNCTLVHRVNTFVEPFTREEEAEMHRFCFTPVNTSTGSLCLSVLYHDTSLSDLNFEPLAPSFPQFIPDYVSSPIVDTIKRLPSIPVSHRLPSYDSFARQPPYVLPSPPPTHPDSQASVLQPPSPQVKSMKPGEKTEKSLSGSVHEKKFSLWRDERARFVGPRISSIRSPRVSFSSRVSIQDDFNDADFCHFAVDSYGLTSAGSRVCKRGQRIQWCDSSSFAALHLRPVSSNPRKQPSDAFRPYGSSAPMKSQEAAMGALILMLKRRPPLQYDCTNSTFPPLATSKPDGIHQRSDEPLVATKTTTADALAEVRSYSEAKCNPDIFSISHVQARRASTKYQTNLLRFQRRQPIALAELRSFCKTKKRLLRQGSVAKLSKSGIV